MRASVRTFWLVVAIALVFVVSPGPTTSAQQSIDSPRPGGSPPTSVNPPTGTGETGRPASPEAATEATPHDDDPVGGTSAAPDGRAHVRRPRPTGGVIELSPREAGLKGIVGHWWFLDAHREPLLNAYSDLGVTTVRLAIDWRQIEPIEGRRDFSIVDRLFTALLERGIEPVPVVATIPVWASRNPAQCQVREIACIPDQAKLEAFSRTSFRLVRRFPEVTRWEFWNEPEMWPAMADPSVFQVWHRAFYAAAKAANPNARVALGTLMGWNFVQGLDPDLPYDAVSLHSYEDHLGDPLDTKRIELTRRQLVAHGREVPLWLTEYGWDSQWLGDAGRAAAFRWVFEWLRARPYVELAHYHMLHDTPHASECCFGLLGPPPAFVHKQPQAYATFRSYYAVQP